MPCPSMPSGMRSAALRRAGAARKAARSPQACPRTWPARPIFGRQRVGRIACSQVRDTRVLHMFIHAEPRRVAAQDGCQGLAFSGDNFVEKSPPPFGVDRLDRVGPARKRSGASPVSPMTPLLESPRFPSLAPGRGPGHAHDCRSNGCGYICGYPGNCRNQSRTIGSNRVALVLARWCGPPWHAGRKGSIRLAAQCQRVRAQRVFEAAAQLDATACGVPVPLFHVKPSPG